MKLPKTTFLLFTIVALSSGVSCKTYSVELVNTKQTEQGVDYTRSLRKLKRDEIQVIRSTIMASITECDDPKVIEEGIRTGDSVTTATVTPSSTTLSTYTKQFYFITYRCSKP
jgi:hypothetical protein